MTSDNNNPTTQVAEYKPGEAELIAAAEAGKLLRIQGIDDKEGFELVHAHRMKLKNMRVSIEKTRKELKADAIEWGRKVDAEAKRLTALIEPTEQELEAQESAVLEERERLRKEKEAKHRAMLVRRVNELASFGRHMTTLQVEVMSEEQFAEALADAKAEHEQAERERQKAEAEAQRQEAQRKAAREEDERRFQAERKRLADERAAFEREQAEARRKLADERAAQAAERERLEREQAELTARREQLEEKELPAGEAMAHTPEPEPVPNEEAEPHGAQGDPATAGERHDRHEETGPASSPAPASPGHIAFTGEDMLGLAEEAFKVADALIYKGMGADKESVGKVLTAVMVFAIIHESMSMSAPGRKLLPAVETAVDFAREWLRERRERRRNRN